MKNNKNEWDRRKFLKSLMFGSGALASAPVDLFLSNMIAHYLGRAYALAAGDDAAFLDKKFIHLSMAGGIPRWYWDLPLCPNGSDSIGTANKMLITKLLVNAGKATGGEYAMTKVGGYYMPHIWDSLIPTSSGGSTSMKNLAQNMLILRGINLQIDSHDLDRFKQVMPATGVSLLGLVADHASTPIPASSYNSSNNYYASSKGIGIINTNGNNPLTTALSAFITPSSTRSVNDAKMEEAIDKALLVMQKNAEGKNRFLPNSYTERFNAKKIMKRDLGNLQETYTHLQQKYASLITRSYSDASLALAGVEDKVIVGDNNDVGFNIDLGGVNARYTGSDLRNITDASTTIGSLAGGMAVAEYMITQGYSSAVNMMSNSNISNISLDSAIDVATQAKISGKKTAATDVHETGAYTGLILQTRYFRAQAACLNELINQLKSVSTSNGNLFNNTVIAVTSEFNRSARVDGSGADHGWMGSSYSLFSGQVPGLTVLGNVMNYGDNKKYGGMWGKAGLVDEFGGREALIGNVSSTVATLLDMKSPTPNDSSFVYRSGGVIKPFLGRPKNIA